MARIRINSVNAPDVPDWVKETLIGLEFPVAIIPNDQKPLGACQLRGPLENQVKSESAYHVDIMAALQIIEKKNPKAAAWIKENTLVNAYLSLEDPNGWIGFAKKECTLIT